MGWQRDVVLRASDVGQYTFCATSWWLARVQGIQPAASEPLWNGVKAHAAYDRRRRGAEFARRLGYALLGLGLLAGLLWIALILGGKHIG